ncbi:MAG: aminopeptidase [Candidatus Sericytochromatia bacterium]|nr:aminopeptidase [Candidatus Sericytochromatia bacterium]
MPRQLRLFPLALTALLGLQGCYALKQGAGQLELLRRRVAVSRVLASPTTPEATRRSLRLVQAAKAFAEDSLGLARTHNYEHLVQLDRDAVTYVVTAAPPDSLEPYQWWFPVIGSVPYKGFFAKADALAEQARLVAQGFDTNVRGVAAFSLLGWLPDPIYSPFLALEPATLVSVVIHETTHATLFLPGRASFNEGFATFVGQAGAMAFFRARGGERDPDLAAVRSAQHDARVFSAFIARLAARLESLYASGRPRAELLRAREQVFREARADFTSQHLPGLQGRRHRGFGQGPLNNATIAAHRTYHQRLDRFERAHERLGGDLRTTVRFFREHVARVPEPEQWLDRWLAGRTALPTQGLRAGVELRGGPLRGAGTAGLPGRAGATAGAHLGGPVEGHLASVLQPLQVPIRHPPWQPELRGHREVGGARVGLDEVTDPFEHASPPWQRRS